jgi:hypothetical protein
MVLLVIVRYFKKMVNEIIENIKKGLGISIGIIMGFGFLVLGYAFVEPASGPGGSYYTDASSKFMTLLNGINASVSSSGGISFAGYTTLTYDGDIDYLKGANTICGSNFAGSRAMIYEDLLVLGANYSYTYDIWLFNAVLNVKDNGYGVLKSGGSIHITNNGHSCDGWNSDSSSYMGTRLHTTGWVYGVSCANFYRLGCVYN